MSRNLPSKEDAINQLCETIKYKFEQDGVLNEMRCMLQSKMVAMMNGKGEGASLLQHNSAGQKCSSDKHIQMLHQLIMEYLHWHGYKYTAQMFASETGSENKQPMRESLEGLLGSFQHRDLPILLELVVELNEKHNEATQIKM